MPPPNYDGGENCGVLSAWMSPPNKLMCSIEIPIKPKCFGLADNFGKTEMCDACSYQKKCAALTMQRANKYALSFRYTMNGKCLYCGKVGFCLVLEYGEINIKLCLADVMRMEHKAIEWKIEEDDKKVWKPHKEWLDKA